MANLTRILVVDDEPMIRSMLERILGGDDRQVTATSTGGEALRAFELARVQGAPFQVVVTDWGMPGMSGPELAHCIKVAEHSTLVVLLTGSADDEAPVPYVDILLRKPGGLSALRSVLASPHSRTPSAT